jgi:RNA polymerase sigma factor (sigma-70 family)
LLNSFGNPGWEIMGNIIRFLSGRDKLSVFERLVGPHVEPLYKLAYRFTNNTMEAEDLVQDLLLKLYPKCHELEKVEKLRPWLARVMYRMWVDRLRSQRLSVVDAVDDLTELAQSVEAVDPDSIPEQAYHRSITQKKLLQALEQLSEDHRIVLILHDVEGYSLEEMRVVLNCAIGTLKSRLHRARDRLRNLLDDGTF